MPINNVRVLGRLLKNAYHAEAEEIDVIYYALQELPPGDDWDKLVQLMRDNEIHMIMIEELIEELINEKPTYVSKRFEFEGYSREKLLEKIAKTEKFAYNFYLYLKRDIDFNSIGGNAEKVKQTLESLIEWERKHISIVKNLLESFGVRYRIL